MSILTNLLLPCMLMVSVTPSRPVSAAKGRWVECPRNQDPRQAALPRQRRIITRASNDTFVCICTREHTDTYTYRYAHPIRFLSSYLLPFCEGLIDAGEDLPDAAAREVLEETGVETEFDSVLAFRHGHQGLFGKSDLFFVVRMRLKPGADPSTLRPQVCRLPTGGLLYHQ